MIVDDEPHVLLWDVLASCGYMVHAVDNGAEALKTIHQWRPDAILLDLIMPVLDGCTFLEAFASDPECRGVPLAVVSAAPDTGAAIQDHGVRAIITKPFDVEVLVSRLLQRFKIVQAATRLDSCNGTILLPVFEPAAAGGGPCYSFQQLVRMYMRVFDGGSVREQLRAYH